MHAFLCICSLIFNLGNANDKHEDSPEEVLEKNSRSTPWGFRADFVEKMEYIFNQKTNFRPYGYVG